MACGREFINTVSKSCLQLLFSGNGPRIENGQRGSKSLKLDDWRPKSLSKKAHLNILRAEDMSQIKAGPSVEQNADASTERNDKAGIR